MPWLHSVDAVCMGERLPGMAIGHVLIRKPDGSIPDDKKFTYHINTARLRGWGVGSGGRVAQEENKRLCRRQLRVHESEPEFVYF